MRVKFISNSQSLPTTPLFLTDHLCDLYMSGRLQPVGYEVKYHLDNFSPSIVKNFVNPSTTASFNQRPHPDGPANGSLTTTTPRATLKRRGGDAGGALAKSPRLSSTLDSSSATPVDMNSSSFSATTNAEAASSASTVKTLDFKQEMAVEISLLDDDDDQGGGGGGGGGSANDENELDFAAIEFNANSMDGSAPQPRHQPVAQRPHHFEMDPTLAGTALDESHDSVSADMTGDVSSFMAPGGNTRFLDDDVIRARVSELMKEVRWFLSESPKAAALRAMVPADCQSSLGNKGSASHRIMTSLVYELATISATRVLDLHQRHPLVEKFRSEILEELMRNVGVFAALETEKFCLFEGPKKKSIRSFLKETINRFFRNRLAKKDKSTAIR